MSFDALFYYCAICDTQTKLELGETSNSALDRHLLHEHGIDPSKDNGKATLAENGLKKMYPTGYVPYFRRSS